MPSKGDFFDFPQGSVSDIAFKLECTWKGRMNNSATQSSASSYNVVDDFCRYFTACMNKVVSRKGGSAALLSILVLFQIPWRSFEMTASKLSRAKILPAPLFTIWYINFGNFDYHQKRIFSAYGYSFSLFVPTSAMCDLKTFFSSFWLHISLMKRVSKVLLENFNFSADTRESSVLEMWVERWTKWVGKFLTFFTWAFLWMEVLIAKIFVLWSRICIKTVIKRPSLFVWFGMMKLDI